MDALFWVRFGFVSLCFIAAVALLRKPQELVAGLKQFFLEPTSAVNLGLLRIAVFYLLYCSGYDRTSNWYASLSNTFLKLPRGWIWLADLYPVLMNYIKPTEWVFIIASGLALIGLFTRVSTVVSSVLAVWVMGIPNFYFKIGHADHVVVLSALVLACSRSGDALSVDWLIRRFRGRGIAPPARSVAYTVPIRFSWLLVGTSYLFPGLWKLWEGGDLWINGHKLEVEMALKWAQLPDFVPRFRVDHLPAVMIFFGTMTLVFEIGYFFALFSRRTRVLAGVIATSFHFGVGSTMGIWFSLWFPLIVVLDFPELFGVAPFSWLRKPVFRIWNAVEERVRARVPRLKEPAAEVLVPGPPAAAFAAGSLLVLGMFVAGLGPIDSWPIAVYPRFDDRNASAPRTSFGLLYVVQEPGKEERELKSNFFPLGDTASAYRIVRAAIQAKAKKRQALLDEHVALLARLVRENNPPMPSGTRLMIYRFDFHVDPAERAGDKRKRSLIAETTL